MKQTITNNRIIMTLIVMISLVFTNVATAQEFEETDFYKTVLSKDKESFELSLINSNNDQLITQLNISNKTTFDEAQVFVLENTNLKHVAHIIRVDLIYQAVETIVESNYFIVKTNSVIEQLPVLENNFSNETIKQLTYQFPNQKFGQDNCIVVVKTVLGDTMQVLSEGTQKAWLWNVLDTQPNNLVTAN